MPVSAYLVVISLFCALCYGAIEPKIGRACSTPSTNGFPFCNPKLPLDTRIQDLISRIPDADKPPLLTARMSPKGNISSIGLPEYDWGANCIHGVQSHCVGNYCPTSFPNPNGLGATFNMSNVYVMGEIIGLELRAIWLANGTENSANFIHVGLDCWSPNININRDPRWGRNMEVPGEDPYLTGQFGIAYTVGLQTGRLDPRYLQAVVTLKHWDAYSLDDADGFTRYDFNAIVSQYDFANTYLPAFKASVVEGGAKGLMCAYNAVNGVPCCASAFLNNTLRGAWNFTGYVTSDSDSVNNIWANHHYVATAPEASAVAIQAGTDIDSGNTYLDNLLPAVQQKLISMDAVNRALYHTLKLRFELGLFDPIEDQPYWNVSIDNVNTPAHKAASLFSTLQTMVLLKNTNNVLPLARGKSIAVIGPQANATISMMGNYLGQLCPESYWYYGCIVSPFLAIQKLNTNGNTVYEPGCTISGGDTSGFEAAITAAKSADITILVLGMDTSVENEMHDRTNLSLPGVQLQLAQEIKSSTGKPIITVFFNGGTLAIEWFVGNSDAIVEAFYPGFYGGSALASVLFGDYNPGGKLPYTMYQANYVNQVNMTSMDMSLAPGRSYKYFTGTPIYPFAYGLSYTTFQLSYTEQVDNQYLNSLKDVANYTVTVTNSGKVKGDEVVFAFFKPANDTKIIKQLFGFQRVTLEPGQKAIVNIPVTRSTLQVGDEKGNMVSFPGEYTLQFTNGVHESLTTSLQVLGSAIILERAHVF